MNLEWIISSCILILVVLAVRAVLGNKISAGLRYALWGVVLVRLLLPVQLFTSPVAGMTVSPAVSEKLREPSIYLLPVQSTPVENASVEFQADGTVLDPNSFGYARLEDQKVVRYAERLSPAEVLYRLWFIGCSVTALVMLFSNLQFSARLRRVREPLAETGCKIPVYTADGLPSPCLFGVFRPAVYVPPETAGQPVMLRHILAHETTHYKHLDHIWSVLRSIALAVHWWNPLVWLAVALSRRDSELACDAGALKKLGEQERMPYGETLLALVTAKPSPKDLLSCATTMSGAKRSLRERIRRISHTPKQLVSAALAVVVIVAMTSACTFGRAAGQEAPESFSVQPLAFSYQPDLNRDGERETIQVLKKEGDTPEWRLEVNQGEDPVVNIWSAVLDESHGGCGTYFLYQENGEDFLLSYMPKMQQGQCTYSYQLFHFEDRDMDSERPDNVYIDRENQIGFDINFDSPTHVFDPAEIAAFMEEVNSYISRSKLLVNTNHWMLNLEETADGRLYDNILSVLHHPGQTEYEGETLAESLEYYALYAADHPDDTNSALGNFLAELETEDIAGTSGQTDVAAAELVALLREASSNRQSRFYNYSSHEQQESWEWSAVWWSVPLTDGNTLYLDASYKNQDGVGLLLETPDGASAAFYSSEQLHELIYKAGELYPEYLQSQRDTDISALDMQMIFANLSEDDLQNLPKNEYRSEIAEALHRISEKLTIENDITGTSSAVRIVSCIPLSIRQETNSQMNIYLEATYIENYLCVTCEGWNTAENPNDDGTKLTDAPYQVVYYFEDAELYQLICSIGTDAMEMSRYNESIEERIAENLHNIFWNSMWS